jgi:hypothetical protein
MLQRKRRLGRMAMGNDHRKTMPDHIPSRIQTQEPSLAPMLPIIIVPLVLRRTQLQWRYLKLHRNPEPVPKLQQTVRQASRPTRSLLNPVRPVPRPLAPQLAESRHEFRLWSHRQISSLPKITTLPGKGKKHREERERRFRQVSGLWIKNIFIKFFSS